MILNPTVSPTQVSVKKMGLVTFKGLVDHLSDIIYHILLYNYIYFNKVRCISILVWTET